MKRIIQCLLFVLLTSGVEAKQVEQAKAHKVASNFASGCIANGLRSASDIQLVYTAIDTSGTYLRSAKNPLFYVYNVAGDGGFVMVAGDDKITPILAYSDKTGFKTESMPDNIKNWLRFYEEQIAWAVNEDYEATNEIVQEWDSLSAGKVYNATAKVNLSTALWDQYEPYNDLCPTYKSKKTAAGCVATSMGILMKYHKWPTRGKGSNSYQTTTNETSISEKFSIEYDWSNMLDEYLVNKSGTPLWNQKQGSAVANLVYHAGVAVFMDYGVESSGAITWDAVDAFINNFSYDKGMYLALRDLYTTQEWNDLLKKELDAGRPLLFGGLTSKNEGHQFIIDGYNSSNYFYINWGWSGYANGFYKLSVLEPNIIGTSIGPAGSGFTIDQDVVIGLQKAKTGSTANHEFYFLKPGEWGIKKLSIETGISANVDVIKSHEPFTLYYSYILDYGMREFNGLLGLYLVDSKGNRKSALDLSEVAFKAGWAYGDTEGTTLTITDEVKEGDKIKLFYSSDKKTWKPVRGRSDVVMELPVVKGAPVANEQLSGAQKGITVSPTLATSHINIQVSNGDPLRSVKLYNLSGQLVKSQTYSNVETTGSMSIENVASGIYIVLVETTNGTEKFKIVKE